MQEPFSPIKCQEVGSGQFCTHINLNIQAAHTGLTVGSNNEDGWIHEHTGLQAPVAIL